MSTSLIFPKPDGATYTIPAVDDENWGQNVTNFLLAIPDGVPPRNGTFSLTGDLSFGPTFGLVSQYYKSPTSNIASTGILRLAKTDLIDWRNNANSGNLSLGINGSDQLTFNGSIINGSGTVNSGTAGNLTLYATTGTAVGDTYTQNGHSIQIAIATQPARTQNLVYTLPNPGNAALSGLVALSNVNQTITGTYVFSVQPGFTNGFQATGTSQFANQAVIALYDSGSSNSVSISAPATISSSYSLLMPTAQGKNNSLLLNDGSGNLTWVTGLAGVESSAGGTVTLDATVGNNGIITISSTTTINGPTGGFDMQKFTFRIRNDASHSVTLSTGAGNFRFSTDIPSYTNSVSKVDYVGAIWNGTDSLWDVVSVIQGF